MKKQQLDETITKLLDNRNNTPALTWGIKQLISDVLHDVIGENERTPLNSSRDLSDVIYERNSIKEAQREAAKELGL